MPLTTRLDNLRGAPPTLPPMGVARLTRPSTALTDQARYVDRARLRDALGRPTWAKFEPIRATLQRVLALG